MGTDEEPEESWRWGVVQSRTEGKKVERRAPGGQLPTVLMGKAVSDRRIWRQNAIAKALDVSFIRDWTPERGGVQKIIK